MSLRPFLIAWCLLVAFVLGARMLHGAQSGTGLAALYLVASLAVLGTAMMRYRNRLRRYLQHEHHDIWQLLHAGPRQQVTDIGVLKWLFEPIARPDPDLASARRTAAHVGVMLITWLMSTPALCIVLVLWRA